jgi:co-chaperonin GroES (HSP10)
MKDKIRLKPGQKVFHKGYEGQNSVNPVKKSFIKGMKDKIRLKPGQKVFHKGYEGQNSVKTRPKSPSSNFKSKVPHLKFPE